MKEEGNKRRGHRTLEHVADMGVEGWGETIEEAYEEAALAMFELIADTGNESADLEREVEAGGMDREELLIEFLNGLITLMDLEESVCARVEVKRIFTQEEEFRLEGGAGLIRRSRLEGKLQGEVKGASYFGARVRRAGPERWEARCVLDL